MARVRQISYLVASILLVSSCAGYKEASPDEDTRPSYLGPIKCQTTAVFYRLAKPELEAPGARSENAGPIFIHRGLRRNLSEIWSRLKRYE